MKCRNIGVVMAWVVAWVVAVIGMTLPVRGGIVILSRESTLQASGQITADQFDLSDQFTTTLGLYDNTIGDSLTPTSGSQTRASASQRSNVPSLSSLAGVSVDGDATAQVAEIDAIAAQALSRFILQFELTDGSELVTLQGRVQSTFDASARVALTDGVAGGIDFEMAVGAGTDDQVEFDQSFTLTPGSYTLLGEALVTGTPSPNTASFDVRAVGAAAVIPLPPALLPGLALLGLAGAHVRGSAGHNPNAPAPAEAR